LSAGVTNGQSDRLKEAGEVLQEIHQAPDKDIPTDLWDKASCVVVIPGVKKVAFVLGGEYGKGVMSCRQGGAWSAPSFMLLEKGSVGPDRRGKWTGAARHERARRRPNARAK
jgi:lipid-binding SYLF domain-containing protein